MYAYLIPAALLSAAFIGGVGNWLCDALPKSSPPAGQAAAPLALPNVGHWNTLLAPGQWRARPRLPLLMLAMMVCFVAAIFLTESWLALGIAWLYSAFLLVILAIDIEQRRVLNIMLLPAALVAGALSLLAPLPTIASALLGGLVGFGVFLVLGILGRGALGAGDVKLMGVIGLMVGYPAILAAMALGIVLGGIAALLLLASGRATRKSTFAYAPYLALGGILTIFWIL